MKLAKLLLLFLVGAFWASGAAGQANASLNILTLNGGQVAQGGVVDIQVTVGNTGPTASIGVNKVRAQISVPGSLVSTLPNAQQTGLPPGWTITVNSGTTITVCNGTDVIPVGAQRQIFLKVQGVNIGGPSTVNGSLLFSSGASCTVPGTLAGDNTADNTATTSIQVIAAPACSIGVSASAGSILCNGGTTTLTAIASGTAAAVEYSIDGTNFQSSNTFTVGAGTYTVTAREAGNTSCSATSSSVIISQPATVSASASAGSAINCFGGTTSLTVTAAGGTGALEYSLNGGAFQSSNTFTVGAGNHTVTVRDANGCTVNAAPVTVSQPGQVSVTAVVTTPIAVPGGTGTITVSASGGTGNKTYVITSGPTINTTGATSGVFTGLTAGSYTFTATDENGCTGSASATLTTPTAGPSNASLNILTLNGGQVTVGSVVDVQVTVGNTGPSFIAANKVRAQISVPASIVSTLANAGQTGLPPGWTITVNNGNTITICNGSDVIPAGTQRQIFIKIQGNTAGGPSTINGSLLFSNGASCTVPGTLNGDNTADNTATTSVQVIGGACTLAVSASAGTILCNGGTTTLTATATGAAGAVEYSIDGTTFQSGNTFTVGAGTYTVTAREVAVPSCTATSSAVIVSQPAVLVAAESHTAIACFGGSSTVTISATGGTAPYTGTGTFSRTAGTYTFVVTDANGCTDDVSVTISQPTQLTAFATSTPVTTVGGSNGTATVIATGGTSPYTYLWSPGGQTTATATGLAAGAYTVTVTDANGCIATASTTVGSPACNLAATLAAGTIACNGGTTTLTVSVTGGNAPFQYSLNGGASQSGNTFTVGAGTYTVTVTDAANCTTTSNTLTVSQPAVLVAAESHTAILCFGGSSTVTISATGGTAPYTGTGTFSRTAGTYTFVVTDARGCTDDVTVTIAQPTELVAAESHTAIFCFGGSSTVTISATGGTAPYTGTGIFSRTAGTYTFTITDANGCTDAVSVTVSQPVQLTASSTSTPVTTVGGSNGTATVTAIGGTAPYTYVWSPGGQTTATATGLAAGTYSVTVTDANGCTAIASTTVGSPACNLTATIAAGSILCNGGSTTLTVSVTGGNAPFQYRLNGGAPQSGNTFTVGAGSYTVTVTDASSCTTTSNTLTVSQPAELVAAESHTAITCFGSGSLVIISATGGTAPYTGTGSFVQAAGTQTYTVTDANGCTDVVTVTVAQPSELVSTESHTAILCFGGSSSVTISATGGTAPYTGTGTFAVAAGTRQFIVTDANGCADTTNIVISQPTQLTASATATSVTTTGGTNGTATVTATGGTAPYTYLWSPGGQTTATATGLSAGNYSVTVTDANGCTATASATVGSPACSIAVSASAGTISCFGGTTTLTATATGAAGAVEYSLNGGAFQSSNTFTVSVGTYTVTAREVANTSCSATSNSVTVSQPAAIAASASAGPVILCNGGTTTITVSATGGTAPYTATGTFTVGAGTYTYTVTDANGCTAITAPVTIGQPGQVSLTVTVQTPIPVPGGTGTIRVSASGGIGTKTYAIASGPVVNTTGATSGVFTGLTAGSYVFTATDQNGCTGSASFTLNDPAPGLTNASLNILTLNGGQVTVGGVVDVQVTVGNTGSSFIGANKVRAQISIPASIATALANASQTGLPSGWTITANSGGTITVCNGSDIIPAGAQRQIFIKVQGTSAGGPSTINGSLLFSNGSSCTVPGTLPGDMTADNTSTTSITVTPIACNLALTASAGTIACNGGSATLTATATGGSGAVEYSLDGGAFQPGNIFTVSAGTYTVTAREVSNPSCTASASVIVSQPVELVAAESHSAITCFGGSSSVTISATGGTAPYTGTGTFTQAAGTQTYTVTDANGCTDVVTVTVSQPVELVAAANTTAIACSGGSSTVTISATGGTAPYTGTGTFTRTAGTYTFTVTDANGCSDDVTVTIAQPAQLVAAESHTSIACFGGSSTVTISAAGGTAPYTGTGTFTRTAGTYTFTVTDARGCTSAVSVTIAQPAQLVAAESHTSIACFGGSSTVTISAVGGTAPYTGTGTFTRTAGTYTFTVTDARGCTSAVSVTIAQPVELIAAESHTAIACNGGSSTVTISATGGTAQYTGTGTFTRTAGTYTFTVTDASGCTKTVSATITQPALLAASATSTPSTGGNDGTATATATGGTAPYSYLWSPGGQTTATATGLAAGTYTVTVIDANGCTATASTTITAGCGVVVNAGPDQTICSNTGVTLTANVTGGSPSVPAGPVAFAEVSGSTADRRIFSGNIDYIAIGNTFSQHEARVNCNKNTSSSKTLTLPAGAVVKKAYLYWSGSGSVDNSVKLNGTSVTAEATHTDNISGVGAFFGARKDVTSLVTASGNYTVTDLTWSNASSYCQWNGAYGAWGMVVVYELSSLPASRVHVSNDKFDMTYPAGTYSATINNISVPAGCSPNAKLTIIAFEGDNYKDEELKIANVIDADKNNFRGQGGPNFDIITKNAPSVVAGTTSLTYSIRSYQESTIYGPAIEALFDYVKVLKYNSCPPSSCNDYKYEWKRNGVVVGTTKSITATQAGTYTVKATDCKNCSGSDEVVVSTSTLAAATTVGTPISCNGGSATVTVSASGGTAPYTGTGTFTKAAGTYSFTVTDSKGCSATTSVTIAQPSALAATASATQVPCGGTVATVTVSASGGTAPYTGTGTFSKAAGTHTFTVTDAKGCTKTVSVTVTTASCGPVDPNKCYKLIVKHSGKAAGVANSSTSNGSGIEQRSFTGGSSQVWKFEQVESNFYKVVNVNSGKVLDVASSSTSDGASVQQWSWGNTNNQKWSLTSAGSGYYNIKAKHSSKAISVQSSSTANGAKVEQRGTGGSDNAKWAIQEVGCPVWTKGPVVGEKEELAVELDVTAMPNPSTTDFTLVIKSNDQSTPVIIRMLDANGKLLSTSEKSANSTFRILGDKMSAGFYFAEVTQGNQRKIVKLIKVN